jgi:hypothetical protein
MRRCPNYKANERRCRKKKHRVKASKRAKRYAAAKISRRKPVPEHNDAF